MTVFIAAHIGGKPEDKKVLVELQAFGMKGMQTVFLHELAQRGASRFFHQTPVIDVNRQLDDSGDEATLLVGEFAYLGKTYVNEDNQLVYIMPLLSIEKVNSHDEECGEEQNKQECED